MDKVSIKKLAILMILLVALSVYTYTLRYRQFEEPSLPSLESIPVMVNGYFGTKEHLGPESLRFLGADATIFRTYTNEDNRTIWFFLGYFGSQQENSQIHSPKHCYPGSGWNIIEESFIDLRFEDKISTVKQLIISNDKERRIVFYWFNTHSGIINDEFALKWYQMKSTLLGKPQSASFVRFSTTVRETGGEDSAREALSEFVESIFPGIRAVLEGSGSI